MIAHQQFAGLKALSHGLPTQIQSVVSGKATSMSINRFLEQLAELNSL